jgi:hypothetical protein
MRHIYVVQQKGTSTYSDEVIQEWRDMDFFDKLDTLEEAKTHMNSLKNELVYGKNMGIDYEYRILKRSYTEEILKLDE